MTKPRRRRRWFLIAAAVGLVVVAPVALWLFAGWRGSAELGRVRRALDADDPGWRLDALLAAGDAARPPDEQNSIVLANEVAAKAPKSFRTWPVSRQEDDPDFTWPPEPPDLNRQPQAEVGAAAFEVWRESADSIAVARRLRDRPRGGAPLVVPANPLNVLIPHAQNAREAAALLQFDALVCALTGNPDRSIASLHAAVYAGRGAGADPFLISMLVRVACNAVAVRGLEQTLAWSEPKAGLAELQAVLTEEANAPVLLDGLRGERAVTDRVFDAIGDGSIPMKQIVGLTGIPPVDFVDVVRYRPHVKADHACALETMTRYVEVARRSPHEWRGGVAAVSPPPADGRHLVSRVMTSFTPKIADAAVRNVAQLRTAVAAIACERFRQARGRWPESLAELPPDLLAEVPLDPYDGQPLRYRRLPDGVVVYAVGENGVDDGGRLYRAKGELSAQPFPDVGVRLWDPEHRAAAPAEKPDDENP